MEKTIWNLNEYGVVLALGYNGGEFMIRGVPYEELSYHETYLDTEQNIIFRKEVDGDVEVLDLESIEYMDEYNLIDLV